MLNRIIAALLIVIIGVVAVVYFEEIGEIGLAVAFTLILGLFFCVKDGDNIIEMLVEFISNAWKGLIAFALLFGILFIIGWSLGF